MIDSHCHLADEVFESELDEVIARAKDAGVEGTLCILAAEDDGEARRAVKVAAAWSAVRFAVGVHPHQAKVGESRPGHADALVRERVRATAAVAIGEIGLDYHYNFSPRDVQRDVFVEQLATARAWGLQLQNVAALAIPEAIDILVVDYSRDGSDARAWSPATVEALRRRESGRPRIVLCYLSIGEAESYRYYWHERWWTNAHLWLGRENPEWKGNYAVRYWDPGWQRIIMHAAVTAL